MGLPKRKLVFQTSTFRCYVSFREGTFPKTNSSRLKISLFTPKGKDPLPTINFQGRTVGDRLQISISEPQNMLCNGIRHAHFKTRSSRTSKWGGFPGFPGSSHFWILELYIFLLGLRWLGGWEKIPKKL